MLKIENISKSFGKFEVLKDISISFETGQIISLIGPNGSGKTTLIKTILGMIFPNRGSIFIGNVPINKGWEYRDKIGYMPQISRFPENLNIGQLFRMIKNIRNKTNDLELDVELYHSYHLDNMQEKKLGVLSGGTKQKVSAALAFLFKPAIFILDEPSAGLDPIASDILFTKMIKERDNGKLILCTSHNMSEVEHFSDKIVYIKDGVIQFNNSPRELLDETHTHNLLKAIAKKLVNNHD